MGDQGNGTHLDHDIRALVNGRHDRYVFLWLMQLTIGEEREMGRCEKERTDFKQQKADHRFCLPNLVIAARSFFCPRSCLPSHAHTCQLRCARLCPSTRYLTRQTLQTMVFGPLGLSFAPYVRSSRTLSKWLKPIANWYANLSGYRRVGLVYDDLRASRSSSSLLTKLRIPPHCLSVLAKAATKSSYLHLVVEERPDVQRVRWFCSVFL